MIQTCLFTQTKEKCSPSHKKVPVLQYLLIKYSYMIFLYTMNSMFYISLSVKFRNYRRDKVRYCRRDFRKCYV